MRCVRQEPQYSLVLLRQEHTLWQWPLFLLPGLWLVLHLGGISVPKLTRHYICSKCSQSFPSQQMPRPVLGYAAVLPFLPL